MAGSADNLYVLHVQHSTQTVAVYFNHDRSENASVKLILIQLANVSMANVWYIPAHYRPVSCVRFLLITCIHTEKLN